MGERLLERFEITERIGSGGFATVYKGWDERLRRPVAIKVVERPGSAERIVREAQASARLSHRNIASLYEMAFDADRAFLIGELVEGATLRELGRSGALSDRAVAEVGAGTAAGLVHAHRSGVVHRDVKPENVLVATNGEPKLVDFGVATVADAETLTATGAVVGTIAYMSPEQADGLRPGPSADVYSLALTLYELWAGAHPLAHGGAAATARAIGEEIPSLGDVRPELPAHLVEVVDACLDPDAEARPLASELEATLSSSAGALSGDPLPAVAGIDGEPPLAAAPRRGFPAAVRALPAGLMPLVAAVLADGPIGPLLLVMALSFVVALARPRAALALGTTGTALWLALGAEAPGAALVVAVLSLPLLAVRSDGGSELGLPPIAALLGLVGLAPGFPALAALAPRSLERALIGGLGALWLLVAETASGERLLFDLPDRASVGWERSLDGGLTEVLGALFTPETALLVGAWAFAAAALPLLVRGRFPALDILGALCWIAVISGAERLITGGSQAADLVVVVGAVVAFWLATRRGRIIPGNRSGADGAAAPRTA